MNTMSLKKLLSVLSLFLITACSSGSNYVDMIKNGVMEGYTSTTIGKAFDAAKWNFSETDKGVKSVEFTGAITEKMHDKFYLELHAASESLMGPAIIPQLAIDILGIQILQALDKKCNTSDDTCKKEKLSILIGAIKKDGLFKTGEEVSFVWTISADGKSFKITSWGNESWSKTGSSLQDVLKGTVYAN